MPTYVIQREIPGVHKLSARDQKAAALNSNRSLDALGPAIQWVHSYISDDHTHCVYLAENEELIRRHAEHAGLPITKISEVKAMLNPTSATVDVGDAAVAS